MSILATVQVIGGNSNSSYFSFGTGVDGGVLRRIGLWAGGSGFGGLRVWLSNIDAPQTFGTTQGTYREFTFQDGERMERLSLWGNGAGTRSGGIEFHTTRSRSFKHNMTSWGLKQEYPINVASGICVGVRGWHSSDTIGLHALGLAFINDLSFAQMINLRYPTLAFETAGIQPVSIRHINDENQSYTADKNWTNSGSYSATSSSSWSFTTGLQYHMTASVSGGIPKIAQVQTEFGWELSASSTYENGQEETETWSWDRSGVIPPRHWHTFTVTTRRGRISLPYEASMQVTLRNGARFTYELRGLYAGISYTGLDIVTANGDLDAPRSAESAEDGGSIVRTSPLKESDVAHDSVTIRVKGAARTNVKANHHLGKDNSNHAVEQAETEAQLGGEIVEGQLGGKIELLPGTETGDVEAVAAPAN